MFRLLPALLAFPLCWGTVPLAAQSADPPALKWSFEEYGDPSHLEMRADDFEGFDTLQEMLKALPEGIPVTGLRIGYRLHDHEASMKPEILTYLQIHYPEKLRAALASAGNLHNPRVKALHGSFDEAVLETSYIRGIRQMLGDHGFCVREALTEKFSINTKADPPGFGGLIWLAFEACPEGD